VNHPPSQPEKAIPYIRGGPITPVMENVDRGAFPLLFKERMAKRLPASVTAGAIESYIPVSWDSFVPYYFKEEELTCQGGKGKRGF